MSLHVTSHIAQDSDIQERQIPAEQYHNLIRTLCLTLYPHVESMKEFIQKLEEKIKEAVEEMKFAHPSGSLWDPTSVLALQLSSYPTSGSTTFFVSITYENLSGSGTPYSPEYLIIDASITDTLAQENSSVFSLESWALRGCMKRSAWLSEFKTQLPRPLYSYFIRKAKFWSGFEESYQSQQSHKSPLVWVFI